MSEREDPPHEPKQNPVPPRAGSPVPGSPSPGARPSRPLEGGAPRQGARDKGEIRRLAAAAFGGAGQGDGFHFGCPECGHAIAVEAQSAGARIACPECGGRIDVPAVAPRTGAAGGGGVTRPATLPQRREGAGAGPPPDAPGAGESRQAHDDQHRLNPNRRAKFVPLEGTVAPAYEESNGRSGYAGPDRGPGWTKITLVILGVLALGAGIYVFLTRTKGAAVTSSPAADYDPLSPEIKALEAFYNDFRDAATIQERLAFVRHPKITRPRMEAYYLLRGIDPPSPMLLPHTAETVTVEGIDFIRCGAQFKGRTVEAYFEKRRGGSFLVDWESLVGTSDDEWGLFLATIPSDPQEFRVFLAGDEYFGEDFPDSAKVSCARLYSLEGGNDLYGYVQRGSAMDKVMQGLVRKAKEQLGHPVPCRVEVRFVRPGKNGKQVEILSIEPGWLNVGEEPVPDEVPEITAPPIPAPVDPESGPPARESAEPAPEGEANGGDEEIPKALPPSTAAPSEIIPSAIPVDR